MNFKQLKLNPRIIENLTRVGIKEPTEIQYEVIPKILNGSDVVAKAQTGSGKTIAFITPIIHRIMNNEIKKCLVITPTRDLANQIYENTKNYIKGTNLKIDVFFGGVSYDRQIKMISKGLDIYVGTPGRIIDLARNNYLKLNEIETLVLDEADEMLDMGFFPDIKKIVKMMTNRKQTLLFSATIPDEIDKMIKEILNNYQSVSVNSKVSINDCIDQTAYLIHKDNKLNLLNEILSENKNKQVIIFTRTKHETKWLTYQLLKQKYTVECLHSDRKQNSRTNALKRFRNFEVDILVATNVAARGIDISDLELVINFSMPDDVNSYIHRIGRTGRIGKKGIAISFIENKDLIKLDKIQKQTRASISIVKNKKYMSKQKTSNHKKQSNYHNKQNNNSEKHRKQNNNYQKKNNKKKSLSFKK